MPTKTYNWVPDDLVEVADEIRAWLLHRGYAVKVEKTSDGFPFPPTFHCTRNKLERILIEVLPDWQESRLQTWVAYAKTCRSELKVCVGVAHGLVLTPTTISKIRKAGIGLLRAGGQNTYFEIEPVDASMTVSLPPRAGLPQETRVLLGAAYDEFEMSRSGSGAMLAITCGSSRRPLPRPTNSAHRASREVGRRQISHCARGASRRRYHACEPARTGPGPSAEGWAPAARVLYGTETRGDPRLKPWATSLGLPAVRLFNSTLGCFSAGLFGGFLLQSGRTLERAYRAPG
jgi:hypothetical protein